MLSEARSEAIGDFITAMKAAATKGEVELFDVARWARAYARGKALQEGANQPKPDYKTYLRSGEWQMRSFDAKWLAGDRCQGCNTSDHLETHHRTYERLGAELPDDLTVLCAGCHTAIHLVADGRRGKVRDKSWLGRA